MDDSDGSSVLAAVIVVVLLFAVAFYVFQLRYDMCMQNTYHTWYQCILLSVR